MIPLPTPAEWLVMNKLALPLLFVALLATSPAAAQQEKGDVELEFTGSLITSVGASETSGIGIIQSKLGRFVTDRWELGAFPSLEVRFNEHSTNTRLGAGVFAVYSYLRPDAMTAPYVGGSFYKSDVSAGFDEKDSWLGVNAGLKFYMNSYMAFDMGADYLFALQGQEGQLFIVRAGISVIL